MLALGHVYMTPGALAAFLTHRADPSDYLHKHAHGDWGELCDDDKDANRRACLDGDRIMSAYTLPGGARVWIITEWDRSATTLLLPEEY